MTHLIVTIAGEASEKEKEFFTGLLTNFLLRNGLSIEFRGQPHQLITSCTVEQSLEIRNKSWNK